MAHPLLVISDIAARLGDVRFTPELNPVASTMSALAKSGQLPNSERALT